MSEPLKQTFIADPPKDYTVLLINILQGQCEVSEEFKKSVIKACTFIVNNNNPTNY